MNKTAVQLLAFIFFTCAVLISCKKESKPGTNTASSSYRIIQITADSITPKSFILNYQYTSSPATQTGIVLSTDSISLSSSTSLLNSYPSTYNKNTQITTCHINKLYGYNKYYYKVFWTDANGTNFSDVYSQSLSGYYYSWLQRAPVFTIVRTLNPITIPTDNPDLNLSDYSATINGLHCFINQISTLGDLDANGNRIYYCYIDQPTNLLEGIFPFQLFFKGALVLNTNVTVVGGTLTQVSTHPAFSGIGNYFLYNNKIYISYNSQLTNSFWDWDPATNAWEQLPVTTLLQISKYAHGYVINNTVYFEPTSTQSYNPPFNDPTYREYLVSYTPQTGKWKTITLNDTTAVGGAGLNCYSSFVLNNKLYCIIQEARGTIANPVNANVLKVFDPSNNTWTKVMDINLSNAWGYRAIVVNNQIYLLAAFADTQAYASTTFKNSFFQLDLANQQLIQKSVWPTGGGSFATGVLDPYLFTYNNKIYVYGGLAVTGFATGASDTMACYDISTDSWTLIGTSIVSGHGGAEAYGFEFTVNNQVYIGLGQDAGNSFVSAIYRVDF